MSLTIDDLKTLHFDELLELKSNVEKVIKTYQKEKEKEITQRFIAEMQAIGVSIDSLKGLKLNTEKPSRPAKYRNPNDASQTWSGLGPHPDWVKAHLNNGGSKNDLLI